MSVLVYDIETLKLAEEVEGGWDNPAGMGFGTAVVYNYETDKYHFFGPNDRGTCEELLEGNVVVSFNGIRFDNRVLLENNTPEPAWVDIDLFDLAVCAKHETTTVEEAFDKFGKLGGVLNSTLNLNAICQATFGMKKTGKGSLAPKLMRQGKWAEVFSYNLNDVRLTCKLYEYIFNRGSFLDGAGREIFLAELAFASLKEKISKVCVNQ